MPMDATNESIEDPTDTLVNTILSLLEEHLDRSSSDQYTIFHVSETLLDPVNIIHS